MHNKEQSLSCVVLIDAEKLRSACAKKTELVFHVMLFPSIPVWQSQAQ